MQKEIKNECGWEPAGRAVLVRPVGAHEQKGLIQIPDSVRQQSAMLENMADVIAIGAACWEGEAARRCEVGDRVLMTKFAGFQLMGDDGKVYRMVNDRDIFCKKLKKEGE